MLGELRTHWRGLLHAVYHADGGVTPMRVRGSPTIPLVFHPYNRGRNVTVRLACKLPYGLIMGANFVCAHKSFFDFRPGKGLKP